MVVLKNKRHPKQVCSIVEAADKNDEVVVVFKDRKVPTNLILLASISQYLRDLLTDVQDDEKIVIMIPDYSSDEFRTILKSLNKHRIENIKHTPFMKTCMLFDGFDGMVPSKENTDSNELTIVPEYLTTIPEVPTDIETAELFDPEYLEDIEIENEENLSLTIHTSEPEFCVIPNSKRKSKKCSVILKKSKRKNVGEVQRQFDSEQNFKCMKCQLKFASEMEPLWHKKAHSLQDQNKRICNHCGKSFKKMFQLQNHIRTHTGDKPYVCHICAGAFSQETTLRTHMRTHSGVKPFKCGQCSESFNVSSALTTHRMWKHSEGSRPFLCTFCSKSFPTKSAVRKHETIHKSEKKHLCSHCNKRFARADHLKSHLKSHKQSEESLY